MQLLTGAPRDGLTAEQVTAILQADALIVSAGLEQLDTNDQLVADITDVLQGGEVDRDMTATVHGSCKLTLSQALAWGSVRVRPYMTLTGGGLSARWDLGVFVLTTPDNPIGSNPPAYAVSGFDKLYLLQNPIGDSYAVPAGSNVLDAVRTLLTASGVGGAVLLDSTAGALTLATDMVWPLTSSDVPTYLEVINALLAAISYIPLWADEDGAFRSSPDVLPEDRPVEFAFTADDPRLSLVGVERTLTSDMWAVPNWWRFIQNGLTAAPSEGAGQYTVTNTSQGATSVDRLGRTVRKVLFLDAADQDSLVAQGDAQVAADRRVSSVLKLKLGPWPPAGHRDVYSYTDAALGGLVKVLCESWTLPLDGTLGDQVWTEVAA